MMLQWKEKHPRIWAIQIKLNGRKKIYKFGRKMVVDLGSIERIRANTLKTYEVIKELIKILTFE